MNGYYWCEKCDERADGAECQTCRQPARRVIVRWNTFRMRALCKDCVSPERGQNLFAEIRRKLSRP
jgi:hypothetical protein